MVDLRRRRLVDVVVFALGALGGVACKREQPAEPANNFAPASYGYADAGSNYGTPGPSNEAYGTYDAGSSNPPATTATVEAGVLDLNTMVTGALAQGAAVLGAMGAGAGKDPIDTGVKSLAQQQAPGMKPDGPIIRTTLAPGAHGEGTVTLRPGKCYTVVAFGNIGVQLLAIRLVTPPPLPPQPLFEGTTSGPTATIGAKEQCIRSPSPTATSLKLDIEMKQGQGQVGVQAYSK
ncbi:MAG TPA: hypothetical protein VF881_11760 [Polyangiaceae bacterium]